MNKKNNKGFTLAEMLIVVAIIGILVAIMIPTLTSQLEKAKEATDAANIRSKISELQVDYLQKGTSGSAIVTITQGTAGWTGGITEISGFKTGETPLSAAVKGKNIVVKIDDDGKTTLEAAK